MCFVYLTEPGTQLSKRGGTYVVTKEDERLYSIPAETIEGIVLLGSVQISSQAAADLLRRQIPAYWLTGKGQYCGCFQPPSGQQVLKQQKQVLLQESPFSLTIGEKIVVAKIHNQRTLLQRYNRTAKSQKVTDIIQKLKALQKSLIKVDDKNKILGIEGIAAKYYFSALSDMICPEFAFSGRNRRPPKDPFNAMLSLGYTLLGHEVYTALMIQGLHPYFGSLHKLRNGHPALVSDLLEEWRPVIVDAMVWSMIQHREIRPEHFIGRSSGKGIYLNEEGRKIFLRGYEKKMRTLYLRNGTKDTLRHHVIQQGYAYSRAIMNEDASLYAPYVLR